MADHLRFRSGPVHLLRMRVNSSSVVEPGDLMFLDGTDARPASEFPWDTDLATTQAQFADQFLGIAHERSEDGETEPVSIDVSPLSVYELAVDEAAYEVGQLLGPDESSSTLMDQQLVAVGTASRAIARAVEFSTGDVSRLRVTFASAYAMSSSNSNAAVG